MSINAQQIRELTVQIQNTADPESLVLIAAAHVGAITQLSSGLSRVRSDVVRNIIPILSLPSPTPVSILSWVKRLVTGTAAPQLRAQVRMTLQIAQLAGAVGGLVAAIAQARRNISRNSREFATEVATLENQLSSSSRDLSSAATVSLASVASAQNALNAATGRTMSNFDTSSIENFSRSAESELENLDANVSQFVDEVPVEDQYIFADPGTANTPAYAFLEDKDTGMWAPSNNTIAFSTNGVEALRIANNGNVGIANADPTYRLSVDGSISFSGGIHANGSFGTAGQFLTSNGTASYWSNQVYPASGIAVSNGSGWGTSLTPPTGAVVGTTDTQTLSNKTIERVILNDGYTEEVFAITDGVTVNLDPNNGSIQTWTLGASRTPGQANWAAGQSITLQIDDGAAFIITWSTLAVVWTTDGGTAPTLNTTGVTNIVLWKVGTTIYGARIGDA